jgi:hypothetical protein
VTQVPVVTTTLTSAEMIKYAANAFLAVKIGFANEVANICERVGAEAPEVMAGIGLDARIGARFLNPGLGWGGSCFGKDIQSLLHTAREYGYQSRLLEAALEVNRAQRQLVIQKLQEKLFILKGRTIALLGLAFKPETDDLRDAPSLQIAERLLQMGARVKAYDPDRHAGVPRELPGAAHPILRIAGGCGPGCRRAGAGDGVETVRASGFARSGAAHGARDSGGRPQPVRSGGRAAGRVRLLRHRASAARGAP